MRKRIHLVSLFFLLALFPMVAHASPPLPENTTVWVEFENWVKIDGPGIKKADPKASGGQRLEMWSSKTDPPMTVKWEITIPQTGYYSIKLAAQSVTDCCSPYTWWFDQQEPRRVDENNYHESDQYPVTGADMWWHDLTYPGGKGHLDKLVFLEKGRHTLNIKVEEFRALTGNDMAMNADAIAINLEFAQRESRLASLEVQPRVFSPAEGITIHLYSTCSGEARSIGEGMFVTVSVYDFTGREVRRLSHNLPFETDQISFFWDGKNDKGKLVSSGIYLIRARAFGFLSNKGSQAAKAVYLKY